MSRKFKQFNALAISVLIGVIAGSCSKPAGGEPAAGGNGNAGRPGGRGESAERPTAVEIELVKRGSVSRTSTIAGMLEPIRTVGVNAQLSGTLLSLKVEEGNRVRQGEVLAEIDARELEAQARSAEAALRFAQSTVERSEQLFKQQIITLAEVERDRAAFEAAKATSDQLKTRLGYARVTAPISGIITEKLIEAGDIVSPSTRLFSVADVSTLVARIQVSELEVSTLRAGDVVPLSVDALGGQRVARAYPAGLSVGGQRHATRARRGRAHWRPVDRPAPGLYRASHARARPSRRCAACTIARGIRSGWSARRIRRERREDRAPRGTHRERHVGPVGDSRRLYSKVIRSSSPARR